MAKKGLSNEKIYQAAADLVAEKGYDNFSLHELAARLDIKPASLYSHVKNAEEISTAVGLTAIAKLSEALDKASAVSDDEQAFKGLALAYRNFAHQNQELYRAIIGLPKTSDETLKVNEQRTILPLRRLAERFVSGEKDIVNFQRFLRSAMHGFISLEAAGFMRWSGVSADESYEMLVGLCLSELKAAARKNAETKD